MTSAPASMKSPHFAGEGKINFIEKPVPRPDAGQLLVQVRANALCGSERGQFYHGSPTTPGHEAAGVVVAAGANTRTRVGTPGVIFLMDFCGKCRSCALGLTNQCLAKRADMGFNRDGGYGPFELVNENVFFPVDASTDFTEATMLLDIMGTGGHAIERARLVRQDITSIAITGAGPIGLGILAMAKILFGKEISVAVADVVPYRLKLVEALGGIPVNLKETKLSPGSADIAFDTAGKTVARHACIDALGQRGVLVCVGHGEEIQLNVSQHLIAPERAVLGSEYFRFNELPTNLALLKQHRAYLSQIITHRIPVGEIQQAFEMFFKGDTGKVIIEQ